MSQALDINAPLASLQAAGWKRPEILAPAGNWEMMHAAVENGADAVYFGLDAFNARIRADNFAAADLPEIMAQLHERGVRGYVTFNTLIFPAEVSDAVRFLRICSDAGVDAVIVQDLGIAELAARITPELPVHASTQMTLTCAESIEAAAALGLKLERVVMPRENSVKDLARIASASPAKLEVFVHGAICVAYSGQCLTSEALGGRSANRGECAQACRLPYDLIVDGEERDLGDVKYLLSPKDLAGWADLDELTRSGIVTLKIEGRLKSPQYVAATVQSYRAALDQVFGEPGVLRKPRLEESSRQKLEMTFSRGFTGGYLHATDHQAVVEGRFPKKRGLYLGQVAAVNRHGVTVKLEGPLKPGDGVVFDAGKPDQDEEGGRVYTLQGAGAVSRDDRTLPRVDATPQKTVEAILSFGQGRLNTGRVRVGDRVWKTSDPELDRELAASYEGDKIRFRRPVDALVEGRADEPLALTLDDRRGVRVRVIDTEPAEAARQQSLGREALERQLSRMGNTPFDLAELRIEIEGDIMVPFSRLNDLRRRATEALIEARRQVGRGRETRTARMARVDVLPPDGSAGADPAAASPENASSSPVCYAGEFDEDASVAPQLSVLCRTLEQVEAAAAHPGVSTVYVDFEDLRRVKDARALIPRRRSDGSSGPVFAPATLRIIKPGEIGFTKTLLQAEPDAVLVRNLASWHFLRRERPELPLLGDYSLNVANELTANLLKRHGVAQLTPSYDLNIDQLIDLLRAAPAHWFEVTIHQRIPMFHMEHCVFCRFLSEGTNHTNCGRPCDTRTLALRDRVGYSHPVKADAGCRNTVYNAVAQSASEYLPQLREAGAIKYRIELIDESADATRRIVDAYLPALRGQADGRKLWQQLKASSKLGVTRGSLDRE